MPPADLTDPTIPDAEQAASRPDVAEQAAGTTDQETAAGTPVGDRVVPRPPAGAIHLFGDRLALAELFTAILADSGVSHGLIGPREVPRLWERHVLNCAVIHPAIPPGQLVIDVGSGAGLPGIALAIARPDLEVHLVEPMLRRTNWLSMAVADMELTNVSVHRGRAEEFRGILSAPVVTARAVAPLIDLAAWCLPLLKPGGSLLAIKGSSVVEEVATHRDALRRLGAVGEVIETFGAGVVEQETTVLRVILGDQAVQPPVKKKRNGRGKRRG